MERLDFLSRARNIHGYKYEYLNLPEKIILNDVIEIRYKSENFKQRVSKHLMGRCPEKETKRKTTSSFIKESKEVWGDKYDYSLVKYKGALKEIDIIYNGVLYKQRASSHLNGLAPEFRKNEVSILRDFINENDYYGLEKIIRFFKKNKINYIESKVVDLMVFDFYIPFARTFVEFKGRCHYESIEGDYKSYYKIVEEDKEKEKYCEDNYFNLIIIKYDQLNRFYEILFNNLKDIINQDID